MYKNIEVLGLHRNCLPIKLFLIMCLNLIVAPAIYAVNEGGVSQGQAYAIGLLILTTLALSGYLFVVMFIPEKF
jgi:hypothetical protein